VLSFAAMLDLARMRRIKLAARPRVQRLLGWAVLMPNFNLPPRVRIRCEGGERLPREPVIFAMNHTDRYNYWPFQYWLWRNVGRYTATWVKGKYFENRALGRFMELTNNIPTPSRGYVLTKDFVQLAGRRPSADEYRALRRFAAGEVEAAAELPAELAAAPRDILGRAYDPDRESYAACIDALMRALMARFVEINAECFDQGLDLLVFPEGTRSRRLSQGHIGVAQAALRFRKTIVPVGCSGSDKLYPGSSPLARGGEVVYRIGEPLSHADAAAYHLPEGVDPFGAELQPAHRETLQGLVDEVMARINELVDPPYRFADDHTSDGVEGSDRFV
jgi:1-acyl-sn-glycerol-3-phosphate acyltransferase